MTTKKYEYRLEQDPDSGNPRDEFDNLSTFYAVKSHHYMTGGKNDVEFSYREDTDTATGEEVESCWGFYGEKYAKEEAEGAVKSLEAEFKAELDLYDARMTG